MGRFAIILTTPQPDLFHNCADGIVGAYKKLGAENDLRPFEEFSGLGRPERRKEGGKVC
ncbi:MAG: hypothetical protein M1133_10105 [Armatimonadetes bacterium]|nr:hypothetical protein [Armatimonadota bacterium]